MKQKNSLILVAVVSVLLFVVAYVLYQHLGNRFSMQQLATIPQHAETTEASNGATDATVNTKAADFTVYDEGGNPVKLSDFFGKPVILNFWASWCGPCKNEMPDFEAVYQKYGQDIHFLMVNMTDGSQETIQSASRFIADKGYNFPVYYDLDSNAAITYGVMSIPVTYFIDADGNGVAWANGAINMEILEQGIEMIVTP